MQGGATVHGFCCKRRSAGFSLIEVLIAGTIFSFGLAGFSGLLLNSIAGSSEARAEGAAAQAAANLAESLRMNPAAAHRFPDPPGMVTAICYAAAECSPEQQADYDFKLWRIALADSIPNARGLVCRDGTPQDGGEGNALCDGAGPLVIKIFWSGPRTGADGRAQAHRFVVEVG
jgi:type IV pilus modification protein PilV